MTLDSKPSLQTTGKLGDVMKESTSIAYTVAKMWTDRNFAENRFFDCASVHLHVPEGAIPKDGNNREIFIYL